MSTLLIQTDQAQNWALISLEVLVSSH